MLLYFHNLIGGVIMTTGEYLKQIDEVNEKGKFKAD